MNRLNTTQMMIVKALSYMHWATMLHLLFWLTGQIEKRMKALEWNLPRMVQMGLIKEARWGRKKVYSISHPARLVEHGVACTECLLRFFAARPNCEVVSEDSFKKKRLGVIPEWGIIYPRRTMLLFEYCTADNLSRSGLLSRKVKAYRQNMWRFAELFEVAPAVVFALDLPRPETAALAVQYINHDPICFVDYQTFLSQVYGNALVAPIYIWRDGTAHPLIEHA